MRTFLERLGAQMSGPWGRLLLSILAVLLGVLFLETVLWFLVANIPPETYIVIRPRS